MTQLRQILGLLLITVCFGVTPAHADFNITIPDLTVVSDGLNPTTGSFDVLFAADMNNSPIEGSAISSYNFQLDVTNTTGGLTTVSSLTPTAGDLFASVTSIPFESPVFSQNMDPLGWAEGSIEFANPSVPAPANAVLVSVAFEIPTGQTGTFDVDFVMDTLGFFDGGLTQYPTGVTGAGGTITVVPEPSPILLLGLIGIGVGVVKKFRRMRKGKK